VDEINDVSEMFVLDFEGLGERSRLTRTNRLQHEEAVFAGGQRRSEHIFWLRVRLIIQLHIHEGGQAHRKINPLIQRLIPD
jgi:hypothetical protein